MKKNERIIIDKEKRFQLVGEIKAFFLDNRNEEIGDLQAELLIEMLIDKVGAAIYNQALSDALIWLKARLSDVEIDYYSLEKRSKDD